jgi:hypothetical protein
MWRRGVGDRQAHGDRGRDHREDEPECTPYVSRAARTLRLSVLHAMRRTLPAAACGTALRAVYSMRSGEHDKNSGYGPQTLTRLLARLSSLSASLQAVLEAPAPGPAQCAESQAAALPSAKRLGNGVVQRAVVKVLATADRPMRLAHICAAVEARLGQPVSIESVSWCLATGVRAKVPRFERVSYGCYQLKG